MIECRHCRELFRTPPEKLGARCPNCRMPLFERADRGRGDVLEKGVFCAAHPEIDAVGRCRRCGQRYCGVCRSRWYEEALCPVCAERAFVANEPSPREAERRDQLALWSLSLAILGWVLLLLTLIPWIQVLTGSGGSAAIARTLFFISLLPAALALGQAALALRVRVRRLRFAASGLVLGSLQVGLMLGVLLINLWHN